MAKVDDLPLSDEAAAGMAAFIITSKPWASRSLSVLQTSIRSIRATPSLRCCRGFPCWPSYYLRRSLQAPRPPALSLPDPEVPGSMTCHERCDTPRPDPSRREHGAC